MTILLINNNPVVSRLLSLCTRDAAMILETVSSIDEASAVRYDVLFVDEGSCEGDVASLSTRLDVGKKVYLSYSDDPMAGFDETIKKPFLPSQVMEVLENVEVREEIDEVLNEETSIDEEVEEIIHDEEISSIFPLSAEEVEEEEEVDQEVEEIEEEDPVLEVLDRGEIEKIKALLDMDEEDTEDLDLTEETYESRKIEVIKEQLIADGLEIFEEEEIVDELSKPKKEEEKSKTKKTKPEKIKKEKKNKKKKKKNEKFTEDEWSAIEDAINNLKPKKIKKLLKGKEIEVKIKLKGKK